MREDDGRDGGAVERLGERLGASGGPPRVGLDLAESTLERGAPGAAMRDVGGLAESVGAQRASGGPREVLDVTEPTVERPASGAPPREVRAVTESTVERLASGVALRDVL